MLDGALYAVSSRLDWALLLRRTHGIDSLACPGCGGRLRPIATLREPEVVRAILERGEHLGDCLRRCELLGGETRALDVRRGQHAEPGRACSGSWVDRPEGWVFAEAAGHAHGFRGGQAASRSGEERKLRRGFGRRPEVRHD